MTIPNVITIARLIAVPLIVWLMIADRYVEATVLFVLDAVMKGQRGGLSGRQLMTAMGPGFTASFALLEAS